MMDHHDRPPGDRDIDEASGRAYERFTELDERIIGVLREISIPLLRISLGVVFVWFGVLKIVGASPVHDLVATTVPWIDDGLLLPALGALETLVGLGLLAGRLIRVVLLVLAVQLLGTLLLFVIRPDVTFQGANPFLLTQEGEFVVKNLVLISAGLVVGANMRPAQPWKEMPERVEDHEGA